MATNPFADLIPNSAPSQPRIVPGTPRAPSSADRRAEEAAERERIRFQQEQEDRRLYGPEGRQRPRQLPEKGIERLGGGTSGTLDLDRALATFRDEYAGNAITGGLENTLQGLNSGIGSPGQRQWWSDIQATDNVLRNALFGASLTAGEQAAWDRTTVSPSMDPREVRANLTRRRDLARSALRRLARTYRANGFNEEAIREQLGELSSLIDDQAPGQQEQPRDQPQALNIGTPRPADAPPQGPDRSRLLYGNEGEGRAVPAGEEYIRENDPALAGLNQRLGMLIASGAPDAEVRAAFRAAGLSDTGNLDQVLAYRRTPEFAEWRRQNPNTAYSVNVDDRMVRLSTGGRIMSDIANSGFGGYVSGAADTVTLGGLDEIGAAGEAVADSLAGEGSYTDNYNRNVTDFRTSRDVIRENNPLSYFGGQVSGGFLLPGGQTTSAARLAAIGGAYGGAYGFGSADSGSVMDRLRAAGTGAALGAAVGGSLGYGANRLGARAGSSSTPEQLRRAELLAAAERQGVDVLPADVGGPMTRRLTAGVAQAPIGGGAVIRGAERTGRQFDDRVGAIATAEGSPVPRNMLGERIQGALDEFNTTSGEQGRQTYARATEMADDQLYQGRRAFQNINSQVRELSSTPNTSAPLLSGLTRLRDDIANEDGLRSLDIDAIRRLRTNVRAEAQTEGLRATDYQRRAGLVLDDLSEDIASQLPPDAAAEFRVADQRWRERLEFIDDVESRLLGPRGDRSAEQVTRRVLDMSRSDSARFRRVLEQLPPEEASIVRGTVIREMGRPPAGQPGDFSIETWAKNFRELQNNSRSLETLFRGSSRDHANDLLRIAEGVEGSNRYRNFSNTSGAAAVQNILQLAGIGLGGAAAANATGAAVSIGGAIGLTAALARALSSPRVARVLARPPANRERLVRRLGQVATREPALRPDIDVILRAANDNTANVARQAAAEPSQPRER